MSFLRNKTHGVADVRSLIWLVSWLNIPIDQNVVMMNVWNIGCWIAIWEEAFVILGEDRDAL